MVTLKKQERENQNWLTFFQPFKYILHVCKSQWAGLSIYHVTSGRDESERNRLKCHCLARIPSESPSVSWSRNLANSKQIIESSSVQLLSHCA